MKIRNIMDHGFACQLALCCLNLHKNKKKNISTKEWPVMIEIKSKQLWATDIWQTFNPHYFGRLISINGDMCLQSEAKLIIAECWWHGVSDGVTTGAPWAGVSSQFPIRHTTTDTRRNWFIHLFWSSRIMELHYGAIIPELISGNTWSDQEQSPVWYQARL